MISVIARFFFISSEKKDKKIRKSTLKRLQILIKSDIVYKQFRETCFCFSQKQPCGNGSVVERHLAKVNVASSHLSASENLDEGSRLRETSVSRFLRKNFAQNNRICGNGSVVERHLAKVNVASSNLVSRSMKGQSYDCLFFTERKAMQQIGCMVKTVLCQIPWAGIKPCFSIPPPGSFAKLRYPPGKIRNPEFPTARSNGYPYVLF